MNSILKHLYFPVSLLLILVAVYVKFLEFKKDGSWGTMRSFSVGN